MSLLLTNCLVFDVKSPFHKKSTHLFIDKGVVVSLGREAKAKRKIDLGGAWLCPGLVDLCSNFHDPGFEFKEDIESGREAAISGGFTKVALSPETQPAIQSKADIEYLKSKSGDPIDLLPTGALSRDLKGLEMTEILDLHQAGAVAFSEGSSAIWNNELLLKTLQYTQKINGLVISRAKDPHLSRNTHMHEGRASTILGLKGEPSISEKIQIAQQLEILRYTGGKIHFSMISTAEGIKEIRSAKKEGLNVTCDVSVNHLVFTDRSVTGFDTRYKVDPPFRSEKDRIALIKGLMDDTVDAIVSGHLPQDRESKYLEFDLAEPGAISLQTTFSALLSIKKELSMEKALDKLTNGPRKVLGLESITIAEGATAELAVFDPMVKWILDSTTNKSKSENTPFWGKELEGKGLGIINNGKVALDI